jgi:hypothetical protein
MTSKLARPKTLWSLNRTSIKTEKRLQMIYQNLTKKQTWGYWKQVDSAGRLIT